MGQTKNPDELSPAEAVQLLTKGVVTQIDRHLAALKSGLSKMQEREAEGAALVKKSRSVFDLAKSEVLIDNRYRNDPEKRYKEIGNKGVGPLDKPQKHIPAEGSGDKGGKIFGKSAMPAVPGASGAGPAAPSGKPSGVPGAPKPPQAPGAAPTMHKMDIPSSTEKANGGPVPISKKDMLEYMEKNSSRFRARPKPDNDPSLQATHGEHYSASHGHYSVMANGGKKKEGARTYSTHYVSHEGKFKDLGRNHADKAAAMSAMHEHHDKVAAGISKMEIPSSTEKANGGPQPTKKMEMPTTSEKANGGPMAKTALSPVFAVRPRIGGKDPVSQQMTSDASHASHQAAQQNVMALPKTTLPSVADHASRANYLSGFGAQGGHAMAPTHNAGGLDLPPDDGTVPEIHTGASQFGLAPAGKFGKAEDDKVAQRRLGRTKGKCDFCETKDVNLVGHLNADPHQRLCPTCVDHPKLKGKTTRDIKGKMSKSEMDSAKCPKCKAGMSECKCYNGSKGK